VDSLKVLDPERPIREADVSPVAIIVSKRLGSVCRPERSPHWLKIKNSHYEMVIAASRRLSPLKNWTPALWSATQADGRLPTSISRTSGPRSAAKLLTHAPRSAADYGEHRQVAAAFAKDLKGAPCYNSVIFTEASNHDCSSDLWQMSAKRP
jgi:hypothetical protein